MDRATLKESQSQADYSERGDHLIGDSYYVAPFKFICVLYSTKSHTLIVWYILQVFSGAILQQVFVVEYVVHGQMCDECHRREAKDYWNSVVQVRQKVNWLC